MSKFLSFSSAQCTIAWIPATKKLPLRGSFLATRDWWSHASCICRMSSALFGKPLIHRRGPPPGSSCYLGLGKGGHFHTPGPHIFFGAELPARPRGGARHIGAVPGAGPDDARERARPARPAFPARPRLAICNLRHTGMLILSKSRALPHSGPWPRSWASCSLPRRSRPLCRAAYTWL